MSTAAKQVRAALVRAAGGFLRNVIREPRVTCCVCTTPVDGFDRCWRCRQDGRIAGLADVVAPLTYAIADTQSATLLRHYKDDPVRAVRERHSLIIKWSLYLGISLHERCIGALHSANRVAGVGGQALIGGPAAPPGAVIGIASPGLGDRAHRFQAHRVTRHHRTHVGVVAGRISHRHRKPRPPLSPPRPAGHPSPRRLAQLQYDRRHMLRWLRLSAPAAGMAGLRQPHPPHRAGTRQTTTRTTRAASAIRRRLSEAIG
jgi:hypothetical protein